ncbi:AQP8 protein, partial [Bucco capensis]|nr:AQP8 protein [Bucco capensis]
MEMDVQSKPCRPHWYEQYVQPCLAELLGTMYFVFVGCLSVIENPESTGLLQPALVHGLAAGLLVAALGEI